MKYELTARRLSEALRNKNMKAQELADRSGVNKASISQYINGKHKPTNIKSALMGEVLGVNPMWLMGFDVPMDREPPKKEMYFDENARLIAKISKDKDMRDFLKFYYEMDEDRKVICKNMLSNIKTMMIR